MGPLSSHRRSVWRKVSSTTARSSSTPYVRSSCFRAMATVASSNKKPLNPNPFAWTDDDRTRWRAENIIDDADLVRFDTLHNMQVRSCRVFAPKPLFATYSAESKAFEWMTFGEYATKVDQCRVVLRDLGIQAGSKVAIISNNRWEWATVTAAAYSLNATAVPMYEAQLAADWTYILNDSQATVLLTANDSILATVRREVLANVPLLKTVLSLDAAEGQAHAFATAMAAHEPDTAGHYINAPTPDDLANLIYTSGTTGKPKGVELTHQNFASNVLAAARTMVQDPHDFIRHDDCSLAFLPWAHSYGQTCELWMSISHGARMGISRGIPSILEDLQMIQPTVLFSVPTLYKKIYDGVHNLIETSSPLRKRLMQAALKAGQARVDAEHGTRPPLSFLERMQFDVLDKLILTKIRARFGGKMRHGFVAGAACPSPVINFMDSIGIPICEGYGLTETSPIITINTPEQRSVGSVGRPIGGVTVFICNEEGQEVPRDYEGEICCTGPNVMRGYYQNEDATNEVISMAPDGVTRMFHTGDLGRQSESGFVYVTGRLKEQYKLENGKYVVPTPIEEAIGMSRFISQVVLAGANRPFNVVLLVPEWTAIRTELKLADGSTTDDELAGDVRVKALIDQEIQSTCARLKKFEIPQQWRFVAPFTAANNMLTPKMSIRRHKVIHAYGDIISRMYNEDEDVVPEAADSHGAKEHADEHTKVFGAPK